jgi:hypothetical protein
LGKLKEKALQEDAGYRRMRRYQATAEKAGTDYDYKSAKEAGLSPENGHWPSRVPSGKNEGLLLKSSRHPTFGKTVLGERKAGYRIRSKQGRLFSEKVK